MRKTRFKKETFQCYICYHMATKQSGKWKQENTVESSELQTITTTVLPSRLLDPMMHWARLCNSDTEWAIRTKSLVSHHSICTQTFRLRRGKTACGAKDIKTTTKKYAKHNTEFKLQLLPPWETIPRGQNKRPLKMLKDLFF